MGNLHSIRKAFLRIGIDPVITSSSTDILSADKIILPGVGHFKMAMENLENLNLVDALNEAILVKKKLILGICLGMQLMANSSEEGNVAGLRWINGDVVRFDIKDKMKHKVPHTGWNQIIKKKESLLMQGIPDLSEFYFVHSYHIKTNNNLCVLNETEYEYPFTSAIEHDNIFGVQYHPEKSHDVGCILLKNFINM